MRVIFILFLSFFFGCSSDTPVNMDEVLFERGERFISMKNQKVYNGPGFKMYKNGQKQEQGSIDNGWRSDTWTGWYEDGKKKFVGDYVEGKPHGSWNGFYRNGQKKYEGEYKSGFQVRKWTYTTIKVRKIWRKSILYVLRNVHCLIRQIEEVKNMYVLILGKLLIQKNSRFLSILTNN